MFDKVIIDESLSAQDDREVNARLIEGVVADKGLEARHRAHDGVHDFFRDFLGHPFNFLQIAVVMHADLYKDRHFWIGQVIHN